MCALQNTYITKEFPQIQILLDVSKLCLRSHTNGNVLNRKEVVVKYTFHTLINLQFFRGLPYCQKAL